LKAEESISSRCRSNATSYLMHNKIRTTEEFISKIDAVQLEDLEKARKNFIKSNLTVSSIGPIQNLETAELIKRRLS
jgi:predicted Zn-dependent peptidase